MQTEVTTEKLTINAGAFEVLRAQINDMLQSTTKFIGGSDEAELNVKIKMTKGFAGEGLDELNLSWEVTRTIKAKKFKMTGRPKENPIITVEENGQVVTFEAQPTLFELVK